MNHIKEALKDKNGDAYIWLCVIVVFISMLLSVLILYMGLLSQVQIQKREVKTKLDSVVSEYATEMFDAIKQGAPSTMTGWFARPMRSSDFQAIQLPNTPTRTATA